MDKGARDTWSQPHVAHGLEFVHACGLLVHVLRALTQLEAAHLPHHLRDKE